MLSTCIPHFCNFFFSKKIVLTLFDHDGDLTLVVHCSEEGVITTPCRWSSAVSSWAVGQGLPLQWWQWCQRLPLHCHLLSRQITSHLIILPSHCIRSAFPRYNMYQSLQVWLKTHYVDFFRVLVGWVWYVEMVDSYWVDLQPCLTSCPVISDLVMRGNILESLALCDHLTKWLLIRGKLMQRNRGVHTERRDVWATHLKKIWPSWKTWNT